MSVANDSGFRLEFTLGDHRPDPGAGMTKLEAPAQSTTLTPAKAGVQMKGARIWRWWWHFMDEGSANDLDSGLRRNDGVGNGCASLST